MALRDLLRTLQDAGDALPAFVTSAAEGATAGLVKYPQALVYAQTMGIPYEEALLEMNRRSQQQRADFPVATGAGQIAGALVPGGAAAKAAGALATGARGLMGAARNIGLQAAGQGAVGGVAAFNENQNLEDAAMGAGLGAVLGGAGQAVSQVGASGIRSVVKMGAERSKAMAEQAKAVRLQQLEQATVDGQILKSAGLPTKVQQKKVRDLKSSIRQFDVSIGKAENVIQRANNKKISDADFVNDPGLPKELWKAAKTDIIGRRAQLTGNAPFGSMSGAMASGIGGAALGGGLGYLAGDPLTGAATLGALGMLPGASSIAAQAPRAALATKLGLARLVPGLPPAAIPQFAAGGATSIVAPIAARQSAMISPEDLAILEGRAAPQPTAEPASAPTEISPEDLAILEGRAR